MEERAEETQEAWQRKRTCMHPYLFPLTEHNKHNMLFGSALVNITLSCLSCMSFFGRPFLKTVRPMLSDRSLSCLSVTLVYYSQTIGWIKMKLGTHVGLGPATLCYMGTHLRTPPKGHSTPNFWPISVVAKWLDGSRCHLVGR